jgi:hypothetical protein
MDVHGTTDPASPVRPPQATTSGREMGLNWRVLSVVDEFGFGMMTEVRGASNAKVKRDLGLAADLPELARWVPLGTRQRRTHDAA